MSDESFKIIPYQPRHLAQVTAIYAYHVLHGTASFEEEPPTEADIAERFSALLQDDYPILVAITGDDKVIGYAYGGPHKLRSAYRFTVEDSIYVAAGMQRRGIGRALLSALVEECKKGPFHQMLAVIGDSNNASSIGVHAACGFTHFGTAKNIGFEFGQWLDVVYMQRSLKEDKG